MERISIPYPVRTRIGSGVKNVDRAEPVQPGKDWRKRDGLLIPLGIFVFIRIITLVGALASEQASPVVNPFVTHRIFQSSLQFVAPHTIGYALLEPWHRWDTGWYMKIAGEGYEADDGTTTFLPMYPFLASVAGSLFSDMLVGSMIVSSISCLIALMLFYQLVKVELNSRIRARYALWALVSFPTAFYLLAGYTESTFLAFVIGAWLAARSKRWWLAAALAACAGLTRMQAVVLCLPIAWMAFRETPLRLPMGAARHKYWMDLAARIAAVTAAPAVSLLYNVILYFGGMGKITDAYARIFGWQFSTPWANVGGMLSKIASGLASLFDFGQIVALILVVVLSCAAFRRLPFVYQLYLWPTLIFILTPYAPRQFLVGMMRYSLSFFPIFIVMGMIAVGRPRLRVALILCGGALQCVLLFSFVHWVWIA